MNRRSFLTAAAAGLTVSQASAADIPIIDTHIHLFDPERPQGIPWPDKSNKVLYKKALPDRYRKLAVPLGVKGAIEVEASPLLEDNQWVLDVAAKDTIIVGTIGNLEPGKKDFGKQLERFHANPLYRGIRLGNLWGRDIANEIGKKEFVDDVKLFSQAGLTLDTANPTLPLLANILRLSDLVPDLTIVVDHLPQMAVPSDADSRKTFQDLLREYGKRKQIYVKLSEVFRRVDDKVSEDFTNYRDKLDELFGTFGEDRVLYGSDWPNSDTWKPYPDVLALVQRYFQAKGHAATEKYFWKNSVKAYRWKQRDPSQPKGA